jgi:hypothetical protein
MHGSQSCSCLDRILPVQKEVIQFISNKKSRIAQELEIEIGRVTRLWLGVIEPLGIDPASETESKF